MKEHPATERHPNLHVFIWRYFSGHHLDGKPRTNATWFRAGTAPSHRMNWWTAKPRLHRLLWRWAIVGFPVGWILAYSFSPTYGINLTVIITLCALPYVIHHGTYKVLRLIPRSRVVFVHDNVISEDVNPDLDDVAIGEQLQGDDIQQILDISVADIDRIPTDAPKRDRRRT